MHARVESSDGRMTNSIDLDHLRRFTRGDEMLEAEILDLFRQHADATLSQLAALSNDRDWRIAAHTLKGSARAVGAWDVAAAAERAESASWERRSAAVADIQSTLTAVRAFLDSLVAPGAP